MGCVVGPKLCGGLRSLPEPLNITHDITVYLYYCSTYGTATFAKFWTVFCTGGCADRGHRHLTGGGAPLILDLSDKMKNLRRPCRTLMA